jgi:nucleoside-diphosphate-sugar epimerase
MSQASERRVLVPGGAGYIGSVLTPTLLAAGYRVRVFDSLLYGNTGTLAGVLEDDGFEFVHGDVRSPEQVAEAMKGVTDVVLLAALVGDPVCKRNPELASETNLDGARNVVAAANEAGAGRFIFASTCSNYGLREDDTPATETDDLHPLSLYAETKVETERELLEADGFSFSPTVLRVATAYGISPRMRFDLTVSEFTRALALKQELEVYDADTWRPYCHVRDISKAIMTVLDQPRHLVHGNVFNVGDDTQQFTKRMIVDEISKHLERIDVEYKSGDTDPRNYRVAFGKITESLGFSCDHTVQRYLPVVTHAVRSGIFPAAVSGDTRFGNYVVGHLA